MMNGLDKVTEIDVLCVGHAAYDLVFSVTQHPLPDEKYTATGFLRCGGGPAANASVVAARLGYRSAFSGYMGDEIFGQMHLDELREEGVLVDYIVRGREAIPISVVLVKPNVERSIVNYRGHPDYLPADSLSFADIQPKVLLFDGHEPHLSSVLLEQHNGNTVKTILDAGSLHPGTEKLSPLVDYLLCSEKFASQHTGHRDEEKALDKLAKLAPAVVITLGERGLVWKRGGEVGRMPAHPVEVVDTTGAGDAFHGAFAACLAAGGAFLPCLHFASIVAAVSCTKLGGRPGFPTRAEVGRIINQWGLDPGIIPGPPGQYSDHLTGF